jgi:uncharacterized RDD family membrane protein YckC
MSGDDAFTDLLAPLPSMDVSPVASADDPELAPRGTRLLARLLDLTIVWAPLVLGVVVIALFPPEDGADTGWGVLGFMAGSAAAVGISFAQLFLVTTRGQSIGKLLVGIRVVDGDGRTPGFVRCVVLREGFRVVIGLLPYVGWIAILADSLAIYGHPRRTWHDRLAGTYVVRVAPRADLSPEP